MSSSHELWILPGYDQSQTDEAVLDGEPRPLDGVVEKLRLPRELVLGLPASVGVWCKEGRFSEEDLLYAQLVRQKEPDRAFFAISVSGGRDKSGRIVHLTCVKIVPHDPHGARLKLDDLMDFRSSAVPVELQPKIDSVRERVCGHERNDPLAHSIHKMIEKANKKPDTISFANIEDPQLYYPHWNPERQRRRNEALVGGIAVAVLVAAGVATYCSQNSSEKDTPKQNALEKSGGDDNSPSRSESTPR